MTWAAIFSISNTHPQKYIGIFKADFSPNHGRSPGLLPQESGKAAEASPAPAPMVEAVRSPVTGPKPPAGRTKGGWGKGATLRNFLRCRFEMKVLNHFKIHLRDIYIDIL